MMLRLLFSALLVCQLAFAIGLPRVIQFTASNDALTFASTISVLPILLDSTDAEAVHLAARTFAEDVLRVVGIKPEIYMDELPEGSNVSAIIAATVGSALLTKIRGTPKQKSVSPGQSPQAAFSSANDGGDALQGKWESFEMRVEEEPLPGVKEGLVIRGSDRRGVIYALYSLSEHMGVSPWYWWADVPVKQKTTVAFPRSAVMAHGEPSVKYRGLFLNDEQPVLWNWAKHHFGTGDGPPFQAQMYEKVFELLLRLRGNYMWPAMWNSMFAVDGLDISNGLPVEADSGPNQVLAERYGVVMGTSHHEPMSRNQKEYTDFGTGDWNYENNKDFLDEFWQYGAERAKGKETIFTVGMRGDGDLPLDGANVALLENITASQQETLRKIFDTKDLTKVPQMWAMYKEVMDYYANGLKVPDDVTALLADDNWGNLVAVLPEDRVNTTGGAGIYYHADYVGDPRDYKWISTVPLAKMWEQLHTAKSFHTDRIWILNIGDLKLLETPLEYFMTLAYDFDRWKPDSLIEYLTEGAERDFALGEKSREIAQILAQYSMYASRRKAELVDSDTFSLVNYNEAENILKQWTDLEDRAETIYATLDQEHQIAFDELVFRQIKLNSNLNRLYVSAAKSNLYATQSRSATNLEAERALAFFENDWELSEEYHNLVGGKWRYMLSQPHIGYQYWQSPLRDSMPPTSRIAKHQLSLGNAHALQTRFIPENSFGAWPGDNKHNCELGYGAPDPTLLPMSRYGQARYVEVVSAGPKDVNFTAKPDVDWLLAAPSNGQIKGDGSTDTKVYLTVDWEKFPKDESSSTAQVVLSSSDGAKVIVTVPVENFSTAPNDFTGSIQGDGYIAIEAAHYQHSTEVSGREWKEIPYYGRTHSGLAILPLSFDRFEAGSGPAVRYDFWITNHNITAAEVILQIGPTLNYILGQPLKIAVQVDDAKPTEIQPIPDAKLGSLPADWESIVASEIREVKVPIEIKGDKPGAHSLTIWGISSGIVLERVLIDFGGIKERGYSYLGPPESARTA